MLPQHNARRYDLDWVRVLAFGLLILYHTGMFYVADWDWHIKSAMQSTWLQNLMLLTNQWRMPLLFFVSGSALYFACRKITSLGLLKIRFTRLFVPLLFGMFVVVAPQTYFQILQSEGGVFDSYWQFYVQYININTEAFPNHQPSPLGLLTWNHLWFLAYLWHYTLAFLLIKPLLDKTADAAWLSSIPAWALFSGPVLITAIYGITLGHFPETHALIDDWYNHAFYFSILVFGYILGNNTGLWQKIITHRKVWFIIALMGYAILIAARNEFIDIRLLLPFG
ncbi:MAG: acyltransferase family protein, partial [Pseudomonadota bacterium]